MMLSALFQISIIFGPNLHNLTDNSVDIVCETSVVAEAELYFFNTVSGALARAASGPTDIQKFALTNLNENRIYYYAIKLSENKWSPLLAFKTLSRDFAPMGLGVWGDNQAGVKIGSHIIVNFITLGCT
jgi:hypothetical protein